MKHVKPVAMERRPAPANGVLNFIVGFWALANYIRKHPAPIDTE